MSKDSSPNHIHFHHPRLADLFEDFNRPYTSIFAITSSSSSSSSATTTAINPASINPSSAAANNTANNINTANPQTLPSFLPVEDIYVAPQHQPVNPEDEDDVVPDQHAVFGITRAMDSRREVVWRDLGLEELVRGVRLAERSGGVGVVAGAAAGPGAGAGAGAAGVGGGGIRRGGGAVRRIMCLR
ncbi:hypothetical protein AJ79_04964 [Helicocarpus griseus UAMH5409]|uniref:Uncharacterized protein n=1 Tax=Helicocarpus griseus UAMH5409 TaxID=1447875 RepID=A0A2B7XR46_9EURO|nr:hypothetical protein AJ79_04964 [Helicocarpus griseus UAMH5409]